MHPLVTKKIHQHTPSGTKQETTFKGAELTNFLYIKTQDHTQTRHKLKKYATPLIIHK